MYWQSHPLARVFVQGSQKEAGGEARIDRGRNGDVIDISVLVWVCISQVMGFPIQPIRL